MREYLSHRVMQINGAIWSTLGTPPGSKIVHNGNWRCVLPLPNVWLGVSAEDQATADRRIPDLMYTPAAVRFVSAEPLLGPIDFERILFARALYQSGAHHYVDVLRGGCWSPRPGYRSSQPDELKNHFTNHSDIQGHLINQIIVGGESGNKARPMHPDWARQIRDQCASAGVAFFFKQWGSWCPEEQISNAAETYRSDLAGGRTWRFVGTPMRRRNKSVTGRLLDGVEHNAFPEVACPTFPTSRCPSASHGPSRLPQAGSLSRTGAGDVRTPV